MSKEHPILFSGPMVRAILNTKPGVWPAEPIDPEQPFKWQTRRVVKLADGSPAIEENRDKWGLPVGTDHYVMDFSKTFPQWELLESPYGHPGDLLWVRETWKPVEAKDAVYTNAGIEYRADSKTNYVGFEHLSEWSILSFDGKWKPSIHMPRWASRITLQLKAVRVERVQDISEADAEAEGCEGWGWGKDDTAVNEFKHLWDSISLKRGYSWEVNPLVWVLEFQPQK